MSNAMSSAQEILLNPADLSCDQVESIMGSMLHSNIDFADLYFQYKCSENWSLEDGIVKSGSFNIIKGVGARAISGDKTGFAYSDEINFKALQDAANAARNIANIGVARSGVRVAISNSNLSLYSAVNPLVTLSSEQKIKLLQQADYAARKFDSRIIQVNASLIGVYEVILVMNTNGVLSADVRPLVRMNVSVIAKDKSRRESGFAGGGIRGDYSFFVDHNKVEQYANEAARQAIVNLSAIDAPAGMMPVVLGAGWPGVLLHEAVGHGLEGDFNRKGESNFHGKIGQKVASDLCTVIDNGTLASCRGSLNVDDEGVPTAENILIENGILRGYMYDLHNAKLMGVASTGNGRRESYAHTPMPRMTNTYMLGGNTTQAEMIESIDSGILAVSLGGGQVDITSGKFVFSVSEAYKIEKGKIIAPIKGATLIGNGPEVMQKISMLGNDFALDSGLGVCGKDGQSVPVGVGQPSLKIDEIIVGGTAV